MGQNGTEGKKENCKYEKPLRLSTSFRDNEFKDLSNIAVHKKIPFTRSLR